MEADADGFDRAAVARLAAQDPAIAGLFADAFLSCYGLDLRASIPGLAPLVLPAVSLGGP